MLNCSMIAKLLKHCLWIALLAYHLVNQSVGEEKVIGGNPVLYKKWPLLASLQYGGGFHFCTATVWSAKYVISAAHCL